MTRPADGNNNHNSSAACDGMMMLCKTVGPSCFTRDIAVASSFEVTNGSESIDHRCTLAPRQVEEEDDTIL
jgi:hypothetical protein